MESNPFRIDATPQEAPLLQIQELSKAYGANMALAGVSFSLNRSEIVALVGENGAGKSTLAGILAGAILPDDGKIFMEGQPVVLRSPRVALSYGISFIPQELAYFSNLTVAENILIGRWPNWRGITSHRAITKAAEQEVRRFGIDLDVTRPMSQLSLADCQLVEIIKALNQSAQVLILDEPTAALSDHESQFLFRILTSLSQQGVGLLYISHRIDEVFNLCHRVNVLRNGELVASLLPTETKPDEVITHMLGREIEEQYVSVSRSTEGRDPILRLENWSSGSHPRLSNVNISIHQGEIVGLFGLRGCGADVVAEGLAGLRRDVQGAIYVAERRYNIFSTPRAAHKARVLYMPAERKRNGLVLGLSVQANISLTVLETLTRFGLLNFQEETSIAEKLSSQLNIRSQSVEQEVGHLSGGNQQKVLLASRLAADPHVLVLHEPTRGVDVGARIEIHKFLRTLAEQGATVLLVTSDIEEAVLACDRLLIMRSGTVAAELSGRSKTQTKALAVASMDLNNREEVACLIAQ